MRGSTFRTIKTLSGNQTYTQAPMSVLLLDERAPIFALSKDDQYLCFAAPSACLCYQ